MQSTPLPAISHSNGSHVEDYCTRAVPLSVDSRSVSRYDDHSKSVSVSSGVKAWANRHAALADDQHVAARLKVMSHPPHYMNHEASHLVDPMSVEYWASLPGHVRDQAFVFSSTMGTGMCLRESSGRIEEMGWELLAFL